MPPVSASDASAGVDGDEAAAGQHGHLSPQEISVYSPSYLLFATHPPFALVESHSIQMPILLP
jgi:hypothetical protein